MPALLRCFTTISIHALCEEGDQCLQGERHPHSISIHALCEEGDQEPLEI